MYFKTVCEMAVQGHERLLISVPIESAYATSYQSFSHLQCLAPFQRYCRFSAEKNDPTPIPPEFWGVPLELDLPMSWFRGAKTLLRIKRTNPTYIHPRYFNVMVGGTDRRRTDG